MARLAVVKPSNSLDSLRRELAEAEATRADAVRQRNDLQIGRHSVVADADEATLRGHDDRIASAVRRVDIAEAKHAQLAAALDAEIKDTEQRRRIAMRAEAVAAHAEACRLMRAEYVPAAHAVVDVLERVKALQFKIRDANDALPDGATPVEIHVEESNAPFNRPYSPTSGWHRPVCYFVNLPDIKAGSYIYSAPAWGQER